MLDRSQLKVWFSRHRLAVMVVAGIAVAIGFVLFSPTFQECVQANQSSEGQKSFYEYAAGIFWVTRWCGGVFFKENGEGITALATVVMAIFTGTLWWSTASTAKLSAKTVELAEKQFLMEGRQADLAEKQHGLMRLQHIAANKPRLHIRSIILTRSTPSKEFFENGQPICGNVYIANSGATDAKIINSACRFYWSNDGLPMQPPLDVDEDLSLYFPIPTIPGFGSFTIPIKSAKPLPAIADSIRNRNPQGWRLYVMGFIHYEDINSAERFMGFCREYVTPDPWWGAEGRFKPVDNSDYEYED